MPSDRLLRNPAEPRSPQIAVDFSRSQCHLDLKVGASLLSGEWSTELTADGRPIASPKRWEEVLWYEDDDVAYLELDADLGKPWRLQRHVLLARIERFALLADVILGTTEAALSYAMSVPISPGVTFEPDSEGNEGRLVQGAKRFLALPIGLPEWRIDRPRGQLFAADQRLTLTASLQGRNLIAPLLIPLAPRGKVEYTWRSLTVGEDLQILPPDAAFACRTQVGDRQWVVYRALTRGNRTFLGKNLISEFFCGVFHRSGTMDAIMEVE